MLTDLAAACRTSGLKVVEVEGWRTRTRPASTGSFAPKGILCHHSGGASDGLPYAAWLGLQGRPDLPPPLCQLSLGRDGTVYVIAAGRANHAGVAKAAGTLPKGDGNTMYLGIEAMNTGSEGWKVEQYDAYVILVAALCLFYDWPVENVRGHKETSVTGKIDPTFDMNKFRDDVRAEMAALERPKPTRGPNIIAAEKAALAARRALGRAEEGNAGHPHQQAKIHRLRLQARDLVRAIRRDFPA